MTCLPNGYDDQISIDSKESGVSTIVAKSSISQAIIAKPSASSTIIAKVVASASIIAKSIISSITRIPKPYSIEPNAILAQDCEPILAEDGQTLLLEVG